MQNPANPAQFPKMEQKPQIPKVEQRAMCFVCRLNFSTAKSNGVFFGNDISRLRKQECAETISNLLLGTSSHPLGVYFQSAAYCFRCTEKILDVNFSFKQLTALENRINHNLRVLRILFKKNFEGITNKVDMEVPDVDPEHLEEWESFTYDQVIQICMKVMGANMDPESVLHPDQVLTIDTNDFLKTYFEEVNTEDDYFYLNSFEGEVRENDLVGNIAGSGDRIQIYAKENDTDSSFEVSSDASDSSSYCSSSSGGRKKRKFRKPGTFPVGMQNQSNMNNVNNPHVVQGQGQQIQGQPFKGQQFQGQPSKGQQFQGRRQVVQGQVPTGLPLQGNQNGRTVLTADPNTMVRIVAGPGNPNPNFTPVPPPRQKSVPVQITSINQVVSSAFLSKFPIPADKNANKHITPAEKKVTPTVSAATVPPTANNFTSITNSINSIKNDIPAIPATITVVSAPVISKIPPETKVAPKSGSNVIIPVINFKPSPSTPVKTSENSSKIESEIQKSLPDLKIVELNKITAQNSNIQNRREPSRLIGPLSRIKNYQIQQNNTIVNSSGKHGPGPSSARLKIKNQQSPQKRGRGRPSKNASGHRHSSKKYKMTHKSKSPSSGGASGTGSGKRRGRPPSSRTKNALHHNDSDNDVLSCSSFSSNSVDSSSSSDESSLYPSTSLAMMKQRRRVSGNVSSSSSIVILSD